MGALEGKDKAGIPSHLITFRLSASLFGFAVSRVVLLFGGQSSTALSFSASWPIRCIVRAFSCLFLSFPAFPRLFCLLGFMCTVHVFSPTFCGLSRRRLRGSELVRAWVRRWLRSPLPSGVPCGLERPLFRWRWRRVASLLAVGWCCVLASPFLAVRHWNSDTLALRSEKKKVSSTPRVVSKSVFHTVYCV